MGDRFGRNGVAVGLVGAVVAALCVAVATTAPIGVGAASDDGATFVPISPCRLVDTRPSPNRVGPLAAWGPGETKVVEAHGSNGQCVLPADAVGLSLNVTALAATRQTFLTFWPDGSIPLAASLNPALGEPPTPNAVTTQLSATGSFRIYNDVGNVQVVIDVNGYHTTTPLDSLEARLVAAENRTTALQARVTSAEAKLATLESQQPFAISTNISAGPGIVGPTRVVATLTGTAPANGHFVVSSSLTLFDNHPTAGNNCSITTGTTIDNDYDQGVQMADVGGDLASLSGVRRFAAAAGQQLTFNLVCQRFIFGPSSGAANLSDIVLVAVYTPGP
ncbi:MAG: hypothetical protein ACE37B_08925 [Ilumatobacter sp.]|uniref:hypothetical protein n=1 Tax=Ilumatobacter sp. TaxID=1967498 RepID=UPI00391CCB86